jgi:pyrroloquinoline quinone (PQQ) biosynthesis protein C
MNLPLTTNSKWGTDLLTLAAPSVGRVVHCQLFNELTESTLSLPRCRGALKSFWSLVQNFPKFMALNLAKTLDPLHREHKIVRNWLIDNISVEKQHSEWWLDWAQGFGISAEELRDFQPIEEVEALNKYLWHVCASESLIEGISATNLAIEGPTGLWSQKVRSGLYKYQGRNGVCIDEKTMRWIEAHAHYDDTHPKEAIHLIDILASSKETLQEAEQAALRALDYYALSLEAIYRRY